MPCATVSSLSASETTLAVVPAAVAMVLIGPAQPSRCRIQIWYMYYDCTGSTTLQVSTMVTTVAELERAVFADARYVADIEELRRRWAAADAAFRTMTDTTARAQHWLTTRVDGVPDDREGRARIAAELVAAETEARRTKCATHAAAIRLAADMLEAIATTYIDGSLMIQDANDRPADDWIIVVFRRLAATCQVAGSPVALF